MGSSDERRLRAVVEQITAQAGFDLEDLTVQAAGRRRIVRVVIDGDDGVSLDDAADVSRSISEALDTDQDDPMGNAPYALEVTSPGIGRPLTQPRHFRRARTRLVAITTKDGRALTGHVLDATDSGVAMLTGKSGTHRVDLPFDTIAKAKVEVEFSRPSTAVRELLGIPDLTADIEIDGDGTSDIDPSDIDPSDIDPSDIDPSDSDPSDSDPPDSDPSDYPDESGDGLTDGTAGEPRSDQEAHR